MSGVVRLEPLSGIVVGAVYVSVTLPVASAVHRTGVLPTVVAPPHWLAGSDIVSPFTDWTIEKYIVAPGTQHMSVVQHAD